MREGGDGPAAPTAPGGGEDEPITGVPAEFNEYLPSDCAEYKKWKVRDGARHLVHMAVGLLASRHWRTVASKHCGGRKESTGSSAVAGVQWQQCSSKQHNGKSAVAGHGSRVTAAQRSRTVAGGQHLDGNGKIAVQG